MAVNCYAFTSTVTVPAGLPRPGSATPQSRPSCWISSSRCPPRSARATYGAVITPRIPPYQTDRLAWGRNRARLAQSDIAATSI
jgi:hypothetical protein